MVHYHTAIRHYALPSKDHNQMLLWARCCEQEDFPWSDQLWGGASPGGILNELERVKREQQERVALGRL